MVTIVDKLLLKIEVRSAQAERRLKAFEKRFKGVNRVMKSMETGLRNLQALFLAVGLAFLFSGMALQRFFQGILTGLLETFLMVEGEAGVVNNQINNLKARLAFLKVSFFEAFKDTGLLQFWIDKLNDLIKIFQDLDPDKKAKLVDFAIKGLLVASAMLVLGMAILFMQAPLAVVMFLLNSLKVIFLFFAAHPIVLLFTLLALAFLFLIKETGSLKNALKALGLTALLVFAIMGDAIKEFMMLPLRAVITLINLAIRGFNAISGKNIGLIQQPELFVGTRKALERIEAFKRDIAIEKARKEVAAIQEKAAGGGESILQQILEVLLNPPPTTGELTELPQTVVNIQIGETEIRDMIIEEERKIADFQSGSPQGG